MAIRITVSAIIGIGPNLPHPDPFGIRDIIGTPNLQTLFECPLLGLISPLGMGRDRATIIEDIKLFKRFDDDKTFIDLAVGPQHSVQR